MSGNISAKSPVSSANNWEHLFECALLEGDSVVRGQRLQSAKDAIMDRIEDSLDTVYGKESRLLAAALKTISEMQGAAKNEDSRRAGPAPAFGQSA